MQFGPFDIMPVAPATVSRDAYAEHLAASALADSLGSNCGVTSQRHGKNRCRFLVNPWLSRVDSERVERTNRRYATGMAPRVREQVNDRDEPWRVMCDGRS